MMSLMITQTLRESISLKILEKDLSLINPCPSRLDTELRASRLDRDPYIKKEGTQGTQAKQLAFCKGCLVTR